MINEGSLVIYKGKPAIVKECTDGKYTIALADGTQVKVRDKDIDLLHPGEVIKFSEIEYDKVSDSVIREVWELLLDDGAQNISLNELTSLISDKFTPSSAYAAYNLLKDGLYFSGSIDSISPRNKDEVVSEELKRTALQRESSDRALFLERLKACLKKPSENPMFADDTRFIQDVEALAYGKSAKSRTMKDLGIGETCEDAHSLLLKTGFWTGMINPHPGRYGLSINNASICPQEPAQEDRIDLCHLEAFAIDNSWSNDPDDAISFEPPNIIYVHVADPASSITFDSPAEKEARDRGATLYLPEGAVRMLAEETLPMFALGLCEKSLALTFKMTIDESGAVIETQIFPSVVKVKRFTYEEADKNLESNAALNALYKLSIKINKRRAAQGAVNIELPDVHIEVKDNKITIEPVIDSLAASIVKECMITAGEGAGTWAASRGLAFPYISQEVELQGKILGGYAGSMQLRRCMRPRILSVKPGRHQGLGLDTYTQVTSPLRRYTDLLAHIQIRTFLRGEKTINADDVSARLGFCEAASSAAVHAERASENHWKMVYLHDKKESVWDAVALENKGSRWSVIIPSLALETQVALQRDASPNDDIKLILKSVNIAKGEAVFVQVS